MILLALRRVLTFFLIITPEELNAQPRTRRNKTAFPKYGKLSSISPLSQKEWVMYLIGPDLQISFLFSCSTVDTPTIALSGPRAGINQEISQIW